MELSAMSDGSRTEWLATYHEGDTRIRDKRHGILRLNYEKQRIEFAVQTVDSESSPIIIVSYPIQYLNDVVKIEKRHKMRKHDYLQLNLGKPPEVMNPTFSFSIDNIDLIKDKLLSFKEEMEDLKKESREKSEDDIIEVFARLLMTPLEQFQQMINGVTSRLKLLTSRPKKTAKTIISSLEPPKYREIRELELNNRKISFYESLEAHSTVLVLLSPIGGRIEDYYPLLDYLKGSFKVIIYGVRGYTKPIDQDFNFKLKEFIEDVKDFLMYLGSEKKIILGAHSLFSAIILEEFLDEKYSNIKKFILISGLHRAPDNFRKGVKALPPYQSWGPFKGQVRKIASKVLFSKDTENEISSLFIKQAFSIPDKVYYQVFRDFLSKYDYTNKIETITKPILALWGLNDQLLPSELKSEMIKILPRDLFKFKVLKGGHMIHLENPNEVAREISKFISNKWSTIRIE